MNSDGYLMKNMTGLGRHEESCPPCPRAAAVLPYTRFISPSAAPARQVPGSNPGLPGHASLGKNILSLNTDSERGMFVFIGQGLHAQSYTELEPIKLCICV